jgi:hypothetical protein
MDSAEAPWADGRATWRRLLRRLSDLDKDAAPLGALADISTMRRLLDQAELAAVKAARRSRSSWAEIATNLAVTRQSAWERWHELDEEPVVAEAARDLASGLVTVPDVVGLTSVEARQVLEASRLVALQYRGSGSLTSGTVTDQTPQAGARRRAQSSVTLWIEDGGGSAGSREPRRPKPSPQSKVAELP